MLHSTLFCRILDISKDNRLFLLFNSCFVLLQCLRRSRVAWRAKQELNNRKSLLSFEMSRDATKAYCAAYRARSRVRRTYALVAAQRKQELVMGRKSLLDERREQESAKAQATARMRAIGSRSVYEPPCCN